MTTAQSRVTAQGQVSVPAKIRRTLGLAPGSILEWEAQGDRVVVRKAGRHSSEDIHRAVFGQHPGSPASRPASLADLKEGIRRHVRARRARS